MARALCFIGRLSKILRDAAHTGSRNLRSVYFSMLHVRVAVSSRAGKSTADEQKVHFSGHDIASADASGRLFRWLQAGKFREVSGTKQQQKETEIDG